MIAKPHPPQAARRVMFTADDFGMSPSLNNAVALAHRFGLLRNTSLMPAATAFDHAIALSRSLPNLCLGVHLTLIQGHAILPHKNIPHLVDQEGRFPTNPVATGWRYFYDTGLFAEIKRELRAQIEAVLNAGVKVWFINGHLNLHLHPSLAPMIVDLAREYGIPALRLAAEDWRTTLALAPDGPLPKVAQGVIFAILSRRARRLAARAGLLVNDHLFGLTHDGRMTGDYLLGLVPRLKPGLTEIYSHPALAVDPALREAAPGYRRQEEFIALVSPRLQEALRGRKIEVTDFRKVVQGR
jgi:hopanoid biosynthesis associated protein HpnK